MKTATAAKPITLPTANRLDHACKKFWRSRYLLLMLLPALDRVYRVHVRAHVRRADRLP